VYEIGNTRDIFDKPRHPYTKALLEAFPSVRGPKVPLKGIAGSPPDLARLPEGCRFQPRCAVAYEPCPATAPELYPANGSLVRCLRVKDGTA
jgi:peptide/nickel transport system ATP-binding protein